MVIQIDDSDMRAAFQHLGRAFGKQTNGRYFKRETSKRLRQIVQPLADERKSAVLRLPSRGSEGTGLPMGRGESMRQAIARQIKPSTRWSGKGAGVSIIQRSRGMPRNFNMAGRMFNREAGWNPTALGGVTVHQQVRPALWFDKEVKTDRPRVRREIEEAIGDLSDKMAEDIRRGVGPVRF